MVKLYVVSATIESGAAWQSVDASCAALGAEAVDSCPVLRRMSESTTLLLSRMLDADATSTFDMVSRIFASAPNTGKCNISF